MTQSGVQKHPPHSDSVALACNRVLKKNFCSSGFSRGPKTVRANYPHCQNTDLEKELYDHGFACSHHREVHGLIQTRTRSWISRVELPMPWNFPSPYSLSLSSSPVTGASWRPCRGVHTCSLELEGHRRLHVGKRLAEVAAAARWRVGLKVTPSHLCHNNSACHMLEADSRGRIVCRRQVREC